MKSQENYPFINSIKTAVFQTRVFDFVVRKSIFYKIQHGQYLLVNREEMQICLLQYIHPKIHYSAKMTEEIASCDMPGSHKLRSIHFSFVIVGKTGRFFVHDP